MAIQENVSVANKLYNNFNERKFKESFEFISDDCEIFIVPENRVLKGKEGFLNFMNLWVKAFPDARVDIKHQVSSGDYVITEFNGSGLHNGPLDTPMGTFPSTGRALDMSFCELLMIKNGKIHNSRIYYDVMTIINQLQLSAEKV